MSEEGPFSASTIKEEKQYHIKKINDITILIEELDERRARLLFYKKEHEDAIKDLTV